MYNKKLLILTLGIALLLAILHIGALMFYWYWFFWWFDILVHFIGGIVAGLLFIYLYGALSSRASSRGESFILIFLFVLCIGLMWELYEIIIKSTGIWHPDYLLDTIADIFTDLSGGLSSYLIFSYFFLTNQSVIQNSYDKS